MMSMAEFESDFEVDYMTATEEERVVESRNGNLRSRGVHERDTLDGSGDIDFKEHHPLLSEEGEDSDHPEYVRRSARARERSTYTVEEAVELMGLGRFQLKLWCVCGLFSATDALEMLLLSVLSPVLRCEWLLSETKVAFIATIVFVGMFLGSAVWGSWADKYGRLTIMRIACTWIFYFGILTAFSPNYIWVIVLRGLVGAGFGGAVQSFTLLSEYLPSKHRAKVLILGNFNWAIGSAFEVLMAKFVIPTLGWRYLVAFSALPMLITILCIWTLPESARYLLAAGKKDQAHEVLSHAFKMNGREMPEGELVESQKVPRGRLTDLVVKTPRTTLILWLIWFATAYNYYGIILAQSEILEFHKVCGAAAPLEESPLRESCHCNLLSDSDYKSMIGATFGEFVSIPWNLLTIDLIGRRWCMSANLTLTALFFLLIQICTDKFWLTAFIFGIRAFSAGLFNTVYIYTTEVYPTTMRSIGLGSCSAWARVGAMITPFIAQVVLQKSLTLSLWMYGGICLAAAVLARLLPIETKGREMKQTASPI